MAELYPTVAVQSTPWLNRRPKVDFNRETPLRDANRQGPTTATKEAMMRGTLAERFWANVRKDGPILKPELGPCWIWTAHRSQFGYGRIGLGSRAEGVTTTQRVAFFLEEGRWPMPQARHRCDNPPCVKAVTDEYPAHVIEGTNAQNVRDMIERGRHWEQQKTYCTKGHLLDGVSVLVNGKTRRWCRTCGNAKFTLWRQAGKCIWCSTPSTTMLCPPCAEKRSRKRRERYALTGKT